MKRQTLIRIAWGGLILLIIGVLILTGYYIRSINNEQVTPVDTSISEQQQQDQLAEGLEKLIEDEEVDDINPSNQTAVLESIRDNGNEFAVAVRSYDAPANNFTIEFVGTIGDPQTGNHYEFVVRDDTSSVIIGTLVKEAENTYSLSYSGTENITGLDEAIVIESGNTQEDVMVGVFEQ